LSLTTAKTAHMLTLSEAAGELLYGATCERCKETRRIDLAKLRDRLGPDVLVQDIRKRLRCRKCGSRKVIVTMLWQSAASSASMAESWKD
jgi:hypothetical protein